MIYESAVIVRPQSSEKALDSVRQLFTEVLEGANATPVLSDDWGVRTFAQPKAGGLVKGHYLYFMYQASESQTNAEIERRLRINEDVVSFLIVKVGTDAALENVKKAYRHPFRENSDNPDAGRSFADLSKDRKMFARRKSCWFTANKTHPDWKDFYSYGWLVSEFGKISPARVSGISRKMQKQATISIKRARMIGMLSYMSNRTAY